MTREALFDEEERRELLQDSQGALMFLRERMIKKHQHAKDKLTGNRAKSYEEYQYLFARQEALGEMVGELNDLLKME